MNSASGGEVVATKPASSGLIVIPGDEYALIDSNKRRAHICCGCDTRNAIIVVNSVGICFYLLMVVSYVVLYGDTLTYGDDHIQNSMDFLENAEVSVKIAFFSLGLIFNITALLGALFFNNITTWIGGTWFLFETIRRVCILDFVGAGIAFCFCYPHAVFYYELKNGVMSRENYPKERVCCDCLFTC